MYFVDNEKEAFFSWLYLQFKKIYCSKTCDSSIEICGETNIDENLRKAYLETEEKVLYAVENIFWKSIISIGKGELIKDEYEQYMEVDTFSLFHLVISVA